MASRAPFQTLGPSCSVAPLTTAVIPVDGKLILDYSTDPPTCTGTGITSWTVTISCPKQTPVPRAA